MNKKKIVRIIAIILAVVLLGAGSFGGYVLYRFNFNAPKDLKNSYDEIYNQPQITYDVGDDGEFSVLKINDTHFYNGTCEKDAKTIEDLKVILDSTPCDFIVMNGDMINMVQQRFLQTLLTATIFPGHFFPVTTTVK